VDDWVWEDSGDNSEWPPLANVAPVGPDLLPVVVAVSDSAVFSVAVSDREAPT